MDLTTTYLGLDLRTPLVASASPLSQNVDGVRRLADSGVGAVVLFILFQLRPAWLLAAFNAVLSALALFEPFADIVGGMFSIPAIVYYLSVIGLFLFLTGQALERRRWN